MPNTYLVHHGIKGQKWGVRRYQNPDGSLTSAGLERYGGKKDYSKKDDKIVRSLAKSSWFGRKTASEYVANKSSEKADQLRKDAQRYREDADRLYKTNGIDSSRSGRKLEKTAERKEKIASKLEKYSEAQKAANDNRKAYEDHTKTGKMVMQDLLLTKYGAQNYRAARARGAGKVRSFFESTAGVGILGTVLAAQGNKKAYGSYVVLSGLSGGEEF